MTRRKRVLIGIAATTVLLAMGVAIRAATLSDTFEEAIVLEAPASAVWNTLADIGAIDQWNPGVEASRKTTDGEDGLGERRRCELGGSYLEEEVVEWVPERALTMRITVTNLPFESADIRFRLEDEGNRTTVTVSPTYALKFGWLGKALDAAVVRSSYRKGMADLLRGLKTHVETRHAVRQPLTSDQRRHENGHRGMAWRSPSLGEHATGGAVGFASAQ